MRIDTTRALAEPGVEAVYTAADVPGALRVGIIHTDWPVFIPEGGCTSYLGDVLAIGPANGLASVTFSFDSLLVDTGGGNGFFVHREMVETALKNDGMILQPIKCSRDTEGASYGNLVDAAKMPGKTASGLWWFWQSVQQEMQISLSLMYRRADMAQVECYQP